MMRRLLALTLTLLLAHTAAAELLLYEGFEYTEGESLNTKVPPTQGTLALGTTTHAWTYPMTNPGGQLPAEQLITNNNLTYSGLSSSTGKSFELRRTNNSNISRIPLADFPYVVTGTKSKDIYFSFLMDLTTWIDIPDATADDTAHRNGDHIAGMAINTNTMTAGNVYAGQFRIRREMELFDVAGVPTLVQTGKYELGFHKNNANTTLTSAGQVTTGTSFIQWHPESFDLNQNVLVVGQYHLNTSNLFDDSVYLWIDPALGLGTAPTPDLTITGGVDVSSGSPALSQSSVGEFWFRDSTGVLPGKVTVDELRVATDWASVTPAGPILGHPGDFNDDTKVDAADYITWRNNEVSNASLPHDDGATDQATRFALWRANFGKKNPGGSSSSAGLNLASVPEPSAIVLVLAGLAALPLKRSRVRSRGLGTV